MYYCNCYTKPKHKFHYTKPRVEFKTEESVDLRVLEELSPNISEDQAEEVTDVLKDLSVDSKEESDDEGWITPKNINNRKLKEVRPVVETCIGQNIICVSGDFAVQVNEMLMKQNVLLQMGLQAKSVNGHMVKKLKTFVLRCHACFKYLIHY